MKQEGPDLINVAQRLRHPLDEQQHAGQGEVGVTLGQTGMVPARERDGLLRRRPSQAPLALMQVDFGQAEHLERLVGDPGAALPDDRERLLASRGGFVPFLVQHVRPGERRIGLAPREGAAE